MNIESLKTFLTLNQFKNFTKTAQHLNVVQSTVTARIKELENELGKKLFLRDQKKVVLTDIGGQLLSYAQQIVGLEAQAKYELNNARTYLERLCIGTTFSIYTCHLEPYITKYMDMHKHVSIIVRAFDSMKSIDELNSNITDIAFSFAPFTNSSIKCFPFRTDEMILVTSHKNHSYRNGICVDELGSLPFILSNYTFAKSPEWFDQRFTEYNYFSMSINVASNIISMLKRGEYFSILPRSAVKEELEMGTFIEIPVIDGEMPVLESFILIKRRNMRKQHIYDWLSMFDELKDQI